MTRSALIGYTGFVGTALRRARSFAALYNSANIADLAGQRFDEVICAGAPASMWQANRDPDGDRANLDRLFAALDRVEAGRVILISTIAVLADAAAGDTESRAAYETERAYGRNRRALEEKVTARFAESLVVRLPALFGTGLRKNFVFDLLNPVPSYLRAPAFAALAETAGALAARYYRWDEPLGMWALNRADLDASADRAALTAAVAAQGLAARNFTSSASSYQYYHIDWLAADLDRARDAGLSLLHLSTEPLAAAEICRALTSADFSNLGPAPVREDMRSDHAALWAGANGYLYGRDRILAELGAFRTAECVP